MFKRAIFSALAVAAGTAAALLIVSKKDKDEPENEEADDEIRFVSIKDDDTPEAVQEVCAVYPYLETEFVAGLLARSSELNKKYPEDTLIMVTHEVAFPSKELAAVFTDIMEPAGYACSGTENTVKASRKFFTVEGAILSDVLNVANQTAALKGQYTDYQIEEI